MRHRNFLCPGICGPSDKHVPLVHRNIDWPRLGDFYFQHDICFGGGISLSPQDQCDACELSSKLIFHSLLKLDYNAEYIQSKPVECSTNTMVA